MIPQIRLMTLGLVTLTFVLEKRKRLRERMQCTEYFWITR